MVMEGLMMDIDSRLFYILKIFRKCHENEFGFVLAYKQGKRYVVR